MTVLSAEQLLHEVLLRDLLDAASAQLCRRRLCGPLRRIQEQRERLRHGLDAQHTALRGRLGLRGACSFCLNRTAVASLAEARLPAAENGLNQPKSPIARQSFSQLGSGLQRERPALRIREHHCRGAGAVQPRGVRRKAGLSGGLDHGRGRQVQDFGQGPEVQGGQRREFHQLILDLRQQGPQVGRCVQHPHPAKPQAHIAIAGQLPNEAADHPTNEAGRGQWRPWQSFQLVVETLVLRQQLVGQRHGHQGDAPLSYISECAEQACAKPHLPTTTTPQTLQEDLQRASVPEDSANLRPQRRVRLHRAAAPPDEEGAQGREDAAEHWQALKFCICCDMR
mmetsp:Transcript_122737/g.393092  ORF Transcript_122737/g.393092 Transcript_122737/m.393092 type:complete len:338 (+) Transcript_122737:2161-3174(+)